MCSPKPSCASGSRTTACRCERIRGCGAALRASAKPARAGRAGGCRRAGRSVCAWSRSRRRSNGSRPRASWPTGVRAAAGRRSGRPHRARGRDHARSETCASVGRSGRALTRSWPPVRTARCRTPSRARSRSLAGSSSSSTGGRKLRATARIAPAPWPPGWLELRPSASTSSCSKRSSPAWRRSGRGPTGGRPTPSPGA